MTKFPHWDQEDEQIKLERDALELADLKGTPQSRGYPPDQIGVMLDRAANQQAKDRGAEDRFRQVYDRFVSRDLD